MAVLKNGLMVVTAALLAPYVYDRYQSLSLMYYNAPERLVRVNAFPSHEIKFEDQLRSCEDAILIESTGVAIVACDPGRERWNTVMGVFEPGPVQSGSLYLYDYKDPSTADSKSLKRLELVGYPDDDIHSLGLVFDEATSTLLMANHRHDEPRVEVFKINFDTLTAEYKRSIEHPLIRGPNSIAIKNSNEFFITNDHHFKATDSILLSRAETYLGLPTGTVVHVDISSDPVSANVVARVPFANGIELINATTLAVSSTSKAAVWLYDIAEGEAGSPPQLKYRADIKVPFNPDNLSLGSDGRLLIAGHPHVPTMVKFTATRHVCNDPDELAKADAEMQEYCKTATTGSWVSEWTEEGGLKHLYVDTEYPTSATATRDPVHKVGIIAGLYAKGLLVWRE